MTKRQTQILNALKVDPGFRAIRPNGMKWAVIDYGTAPSTVLIDNISFGTVEALCYAGVGIQDVGQNYLALVGE
jgi:hypothetical protein